MVCRAGRGRNSGGQGKKKGNCSQTAHKASMQLKIPPANQAFWKLFVV
jgi:hypothetical protein